MRPPQAIGKFIAGQIDEAQLEAIAENGPDEKTRAEQLCEAHFYIALVRLHAGDRPTARLRFRAAEATQKTKFFEHTLAKAELQRLAPR